MTFSWRFPTRKTIEPRPAALLVMTLVITSQLLSSSGDAADEQGPIKVFLLVGQSNMQGHGRIQLDKPGDLHHAATQDQFAYLKEGEDWVERDDVWYYHKNGKGEVTQGSLRPGMGANASSVGPELAFGHVLGEHFEEQVLLIKCAWGGQAIAMTFRPPSAGLPSEATLETMYAKAKKKNPDLSIEDYKQVFGSKYRQTLEEVNSVLDSLDQHFPAAKGRDVSLEGIVWHQGWNDGTNRAFAEEYESNMLHFVRDIRKALDDEELPFVIATSGMGGPDATGVAGYLAKSIEPAQVAAADQLDHCIAVPTRHFQRHQPGRQKSHWYNSAESYCLVGDAAAQAMLKLLGEE